MRAPFSRHTEPDCLVCLTAVAALVNHTIKYSGSIEDVVDYFDADRPLSNHHTPQATRQPMLNNACAL